MTRSADNAPSLWLTEQDVYKTVSLNDAIDALEKGIVLEANGQASNVAKALGVWGQHRSMHALGSMMPERGYVGFKTWANTPDGAMAVFSMYSADNGALLCQMEAALLGKLRTSGISGLATKWLAPAAADEMAIIGTGFQAFPQIAAVAATRKLSRLRIFSPTKQSRDAFAEKASEALPFKVTVCETLGDALDGVPIVTVVTRASEPFVHGDLIAKGAHINACGAVLPANAELHLDVLDRCDLVVVDNIANARANARELKEKYGDVDEEWKAVRTLGDVISGKASRTGEADVTLFKPMGMGLSDLSVAIAVYERAKEQGLGVELPAGQRVDPRWQIYG